MLSPRCTRASCAPVASSARTLVVALSTSALSNLGKAVYTFPIRSVQDTTMQHQLRGRLIQVLVQLESSCAHIMMFPTLQLSRCARQACLSLKHSVLVGHWRSVPPFTRKHASALYATLNWSRCVDQALWLSNIVIRRGGRAVSSPAPASATATCAPLHLLTVPCSGQITRDRKRGCSRSQCACVNLLLSVRL